MALVLTLTDRSGTPPYSRRLRTARPAAETAPTAKFDDRFFSVRNGAKCSREATRGHEISISSAAWVLCFAQVEPSYMWLWWPDLPGLVETAVLLTQIQAVEPNLNPTREPEQSRYF